jgi:hypothetical protein
MLIDAGHDVQIPADVEPPLIGADDELHFAHARASQRAILTLNARDFKMLHDQGNDHCGILAIYQDNDPTRDMTYRDIVEAIAHLERTEVSIARGFWILNAYRW